MPESSTIKKKREEWVDALSPKALLFTFARLQATPIEQLKQAELSSMTASLKTKTTLNLDDAKREIDGWLAGPALTIPWNEYPHVLAAEGQAQQGSQAAASAVVPVIPGAPVGNVGASSVSSGSQLSTQLSTQLEQLTSAVNKLVDQSGGTSSGKRKKDRRSNKHGTKKRSASSKLMKALSKTKKDSSSDDDNDDSDSDSEPDQPIETDDTGGAGLMPALRGFNSGTDKYTTRQLLALTEIHSANSTSVNGFVSSLRRMLEVVKASDKDKQLWSSILGQWETSMSRIFEEAIKTKTVSPTDKLRLEHGYVVAIKGKTMYPGSKINLVDAAVKAQPDVIKAVAAIPEPQFYGGRGGGGGKGRGGGGKGRGGGGGFAGSCYDCGKPGHRGFECQASAAEKEAFRAGKGGGRGGAKE